MYTLLLLHLPSDT